MVVSDLVFLLKCAIEYILLVHHNNFNVIFHDIAKDGSGNYSGLGQTVGCLDLQATESASGSARPPSRAETTKYSIVFLEKDSVMEKEREKGREIQTRDNGIYQQMIKTH